MNKKFLTLIIVSIFVSSLFGYLAGLTAKNDTALADFGLFDNILKLFQKSATSSLLAPIETPQPQENFSTINYEETVIKAVESASDGVVSIIISKNLPIIEQCPYNPFGDLPQEFQQFFGPFGGSEFYQPCQKGTKLQEVGGGSGFIVSADGLILTNKHVVVDTKASYTVLTNDGKKYSAEVLARDPAQDLAVVKIEASNLTALKLGDSDKIKLGQTAIAIGNALGEFRNTVSKGVISGLSRTITASGGEGFSETIENVIQTDAAINEGNSGGPLLNINGEVVGINTAMVSGAQSIGFAIPINQAKRAIDSVQKTGKIIVPYLGVRYLLINADLKESQKLPVDYGALLKGNNGGPAVMKNSPAAKAGLQADDIILELNGQKIDQNNSLAFLLQKYQVGDTVTLKILRSGKEIMIQVALEERKF